MSLLTSMFWAAGEIRLVRSFAAADHGVQRQTIAMVSIKPVSRAGQVRVCQITNKDMLTEVGPLSSQEMSRHLYIRKELLPQSLQPSGHTTEQGASSTPSLDGNISNYYAHSEPLRTIRKAQRSSKRCPPIRTI